MKRLSLVIFGVVAGISLATPTRGEDNTPPPGFTALFNGKDLTGWQGLVELPQRAKLTPEQLAAKQKEANEKILPNWTARDGVLHYNGKANSLQTAKDYGDFELWVDWKIGKAGDSGIYLRGNPQVQIWDPEAAPVTRSAPGACSTTKKTPRTRASVRTSRWVSGTRFGSS